MARNRYKSGRQSLSPQGVVFLAILLVVVGWALFAPRKEEPKLPLEVEDHYVISWCSGCQVELVTKTLEKDGRQRRRYAIKDANAVFFVPPRVEVNMIEAPAHNMLTLPDGRVRLTGIKLVEFTFQYPPPQGR